jgi:DNA invertase Pin-like site-specific DNA recombinase
MPDERSERARMGLKMLGVARQSALDLLDDIAWQIKAQVSEAQALGMEATEIASLLGISRSTLYRVYLDRGK